MTCNICRGLPSDAARAELPAASAAASHSGAALRAGGGLEGGAGLVLGGGGAGGSSATCAVGAPPPRRASASAVITSSLGHRHYGQKVRGRAASPSLELTLEGYTGTLVHWYTVNKQ